MDRLVTVVGVDHNGVAKTEDLDLNPPIMEVEEIYRDDKVCIITFTKRYIRIPDGTTT